MIKKVTVLALAVCLLFQTGLTANAATPKEYYYKGFNLSYNNGNGFYAFKDTWNGGFLWLTKYEDRYYNTHSYYRCVTDYSDVWIANQGQVLTIKTNRTRTRSVQSTVSTEIGVSKVATFNFGSSCTASVSTSYSTALGCKYDLSKFKHSSYKIAAMGYIDRYRISRYADGKYQSSSTKYCYDKKFGQEVRLVYRY